MNMKAKFQRFWTLSKNRKGFTLVELIVVIAILAILAGVAIPVYNGYIKKAQEAADQQLLDSINTAFAAACLSNGMDHTLAVGDLTINDDGTIAKTGARASATPVAAAEYWYFDAVVYLGENVRDAVDPAFAMFYAGNEGAKFSEAFMEKNGKKLIVTGSDDENAGKKEVTFNGKTYYVSESIINNFKNSVFHGKEDAMQDQLTGISNAFGQFVGDKASAAGISPGLVDFMNKNGYTDDQLGNAAVLYVAQNAGDYSAQDVAQMFQDIANANPQNMGEALNAFDSDKDALTSIALMYGAATAYANSDVGKQANPELAGQLANVNDGNTLLAALGTLNNNSSWSSYLGVAEEGQVTASTQFTNDMNGFLGAMDALNTVSKDVDVNNKNVWNEQGGDIDKLLESLLGSSN